MLGAFRALNTTLENPQIPISSAEVMTLFGSVPTVAGINVSEVSSLTSAAVWRAASLNATVPASLPFNAYKTSGAGRVEMGPSTQAARLMAQPHPDMTRFEFWQTLHLHRDLWGNAICLKDGPRDRNGNLITVTSLWPILPQRVRIWRDGESRQKLFAFDVIDGEGTPSGILTEADVLHIPGMSYDGVSGVSRIRMARQSIGLSMAAEESGARFFGSGLMASGILQTEQRLTQPQADALSRRWREKRTGLNNAFDTIVLDKGAKFEQLTIPPGDAQFLESRRFQVTEVCRWFGVPPFLMFETETSTSWGTGLEQQALAWVKYDLAPNLVPIEQRMDRILQPKPAYSKHSLDALLRGDAAARAAFYTAMWNIGALSDNEIRDYEDLAPFEGGDTHYRPLAMGEVGQPNTEPTGPIPASTGGQP